MKYISINENLYIRVTDIKELEMKDCDVIIRRDGCEDYTCRFTSRTDAREYFEDFLDELEE